MKKQNIAYGSVGAIIVLMFLVFALRSCMRSTSAETLTNAESSSSGFVKPCVADPKTGICNPQEKNPYADFDHDAFMAMVKSQVASSASSSDQNPQVVARSVSRTESSVSRSGYAGASEVSSKGLAGDCDPSIDSSDSPEGSDGASDSGSQASTAASSDPGSYDISGKCDGRRSFVNAFFEPGDMSLGSTGWLFPRLIDGNCPIRAAMLKGPSTTGGLGGPINDF